MGYKPPRGNLRSDQWIHVKMFFICVCPNTNQPSLFCLSACLLQDEESVPLELRNLPEYKELIELKRLKKQKLQEIHEDKPGMRHVGYKVRTYHFCTTLKPDALSVQGLMNL